jgi:hypothetical protein
MASTKSAMNWPSADGVGAASAGGRWLPEHRVRRSEIPSSHQCLQLARPQPKLCCTRALGPLLLPGATTAASGFAPRTSVRTAIGSLAP